jgi:hypothetical protein
VLSLLVRCKYQQKKKSAGVKTGTGKRSAADDIKMGVVPVESRGKGVDWRRAGGFKVRCCIKAFSLDSECTFAFCPSCDTEVTSEVNELMGVGVGRRGRPKRSKSRAVNNDICSAAHETVGVEKGDGGSDGTCNGMHTKMDMLTINHIIDNKSYLASAQCRTKETLDANIARYCVFCGDEF